MLITKEVIVQIIKSFTENIILFFVFFVCQVMAVINFVDAATI